MKPRWHHIPQIIADAALVAASLLLAFLIRFEFSIPANDWRILRDTIVLVIAVKLLVFFLSGLYDRMWRYVSIRELMVLLRAVLISSVAIVIPLFFLEQTGFPRSVVIIDGLLTLVFVGGVRFVVRYLFEVQKHRSVLAGSTPVLIFGAGDAGEMIVREMLKHPDVEYDPVGFVDDDPTKKGRRIHGVEVLGTHNNILDLAQRYEIEEVVIAIPSAPSHVIRDAVALCDRAGVKCKTLPGMFEMIDGRVELSLIRDVKVEDLLGREPVKIDLAEAASCIKGANILVTGAAGSIGSELCRQISRFDPDHLVLLDHNENDMYFLMDELKNKHPELRFKIIIGDIKDEELVDYVFSQYMPQVVFHAAAHKHVPLMQENPAAAVSNNVSGTRVVIDTADKYKTGRFVMISTDKAVDPTGIMGTTKRISEMLVQVKDKASDTKYMAVRFGNVIGSNGSVVPVFKKQIELGGPVTVTHPEATRYFMSVREATQLVMQAGAIGNGGEIFVLDMGEPVKIIDLARNLIKLSGLEPEVDIPIKITGLRPGEVLTEDLIGQYEEMTHTIQDKVMVIKDSVFDHDKFVEDVTELEMLVKMHDYEKIHSKMKSMVPSYEVKTSAKA